MLHAVNSDGLPAWKQRLMLTRKLVNEGRVEGVTGECGSVDCLDDSVFYEDLSDLESDATDMESNEEMDQCASEGASDSPEEQEDEDPDAADTDDAEDSEDDNLYDGFESDMSYEGSDADLYYQVKERREEVKESRIEHEALKKKQRRFEFEKENEVRAVYKSFKKDRKKGIQFPLSIHKTARSYELFSCDHVEHLWDDVSQCTRRLDIDVYDEALLQTLSGGYNANELGQVHGRIYLDGATTCDFGPFEPPRFARRRTSTYRAEGLYDVSVRFVGENHVRVMLPREFVTCDGSRPVSESAPEVFTFYGIVIDFDKRIADSRRARECAPY